MNGKENRAEVFMKAFESLSNAEKRGVVSRLLDDPQLREEALEIGLVRECDTEPTRPLEKNLADRDANEG